MGESDEEVVGVPAEVEPAGVEPESSLVPPEPGEVVGPDASATAVQAQLALDELLDEFAAQATDVEGSAAEEVAAADGPDAEQPTPEESQAQTLAEEPAEATTEEPPGEGLASDEPTENQSADATDGVSADEASAESAEEAEEEDDLAAAIAASNEQVGSDGTLDDIAPGTAQPVAADEVAAELGHRYGAPWWPFAIYLACWFVFAGIAVWQFQQLPQGAVVYESQQYTMFVFAGLALAASGVFLILAVWLGAWLSPTRHKAGLFSSAFIMGAVCILIGMVVWWGTLMALDYLRLGRVI